MQAHMGELWRRITGTAGPDRCAQSFRLDLSPAGSNVPQLFKARRWTRLNRHSIERAGETRGRPKAHPLNSAALASADQGAQLRKHVQHVQQIEASDLDKKRK